MHFFNGSIHVYVCRTSGDPSLKRMFHFQIVHLVKLMSEQAIYSLNRHNGVESHTLRGVFFFCYSETKYFHWFPWFVMSDHALAFYYIKLTDQCWLHRDWGCLLYTSSHQGWQRCHSGSCWNATLQLPGGEKHTPIAVYKM